MNLYYVPRPGFFHFLLILLILTAPSFCIIAQQTDRSESDNDSVTKLSRLEIRRVQDAADRFIKRFHETLDFKTVYKETFLIDSIHRHRIANFFSELNIANELVIRLDDKTLERVYVANMNEIYLKAIYDAGVSEETPLDVLAVIEGSKFNNLLSDQGSGDLPIIDSREDLEQFIDDLGKVARLYKKHIPKNVFRLARYKENLKAINKDKRSNVGVFDGYEELGIKAGTKVYTIEQEMFIFFFIEEDGKLKILTLGMGN